MLYTRSAGRSCAPALGLQLRWSRRGPAACSAPRAGHQARVPAGLPRRRRSRSPGRRARHRTCAECHAAGLGALAPRAAAPPGGRQGRRHVPGGPRAACPRGRRSCRGGRGACRGWQGQSTSDSLWLRGGRPRRQAGPPPRLHAFAGRLPAPAASATPG